MIDTKKYSPIYLIYNEWLVWPTKILVNEKRVNTVVSCPRKLLEPVQNFLEFTQKIFVPLLYKALQWIHINLHLQYLFKNVIFIFILWVSQFMVALNAKMHVIVINLATGAKVSLKLTQATWKNPIVINCALDLTISSNTSFLVQNIYLHPTLLRLFGRLVNSYVPLAMSKSNSSCIMAFHLLASLDLNTSYKFKGSSNYAT